MALRRQRCAQILSFLDYLLSNHLQYQYRANVLNAATYCHYWQLAAAAGWRGGPRDFLGAAARRDVDKPRERERARPTLFLCAALNASLTANEIPSAARLLNKATSPS